MFRCIIYFDYVLPFSCTWSWLQNTFASYLRSKRCLLLVLAGSAVKTEPYIAGCFTNWSVLLHSWRTETLGEGPSRQLSLRSSIVRRGAHQVSSLMHAGSSEEVSFSFLALPSCGIFFCVFVFSFLCSWRYQSYKLH